MRVPSQAVPHSEAVAGCKTHALQTASAPGNVRVAIAVSKYNEAITGRLVNGAVETLNAAGVSSERIEIAEVPGAFELPLAAHALARSGQFAAVLCLGAVIRGETTHDQHINTAVANGVESVGRQHGIPVLFGLLTCETRSQAEARAGGDVGNKGDECAQAAIAMMNLLEDLSEN
ncbi:MAG: 6,7-dimethyl-8-ribityllumazine synthase [Pirellulales bacterium]|jgi:6,7-dimethyl-8-ribityllumazine synthase|nr:6,7-dimethyl-8-ribityllumazine synthase [Pirellulales bacterium]